MKKLKQVFPTLFVGIAFFILSACATTPEESCEQDEICSGKTVTACCTDDECYYTYDGVKYGDDPASLLELAKALGCTSATSPEFDHDIQQIMSRLVGLSEVAQINKY